MRYGKFINKDSSIGVNAPSFSCGGYPYEYRGRQAVKNFESMGFKVKCTPGCFGFDITNLIDKNFSFKQKADEFMGQYLDDNIDIIFSMAGGELEVGTINNIDFEKIKNGNPKYVVGYSDNTWLTFLLPTICDVCSVYSYNFSSFGCLPLHKSHIKLIDLLTCKSYKQESYDKYEIEDLSKIKDGNPLATINDVIKSEWKSLNNKTAEMQGRIIGGCLDVLVNIIGTKYDNMEAFNEKYKDDGIIFFFESCDLNILSQLRAYLQIKNSNWLKYTKGIVIGRPLNKETMYGVDYERMLHEAFDDLNIPVIYDCDIGHLAPNLSIFCGSINKIKLENKKGTIETLFI